MSHTLCFNSQPFMSAIALRQSSEKLMKPGRCLSLRNGAALIPNHLQARQHSSAGSVSHAPLTHSWEASAFRASTKSHHHVPSRPSRISRPPPIQKRAISSTKMAETGPSEQIQALLPSRLLGELSSLWFQHIVNEQDLVVPSQDTMMHWFRKDEAFDQLCSCVPNDLTATWVGLMPFDMC